MLKISFFKSINENFNCLFYIFPTFFGVRLKDLPPIINSNLINLNIIITYF